MTTNNIPPLQEAFKHSFDGACAPGVSTFASQIGFSVGVFQWVPKASGKGLKRTAVKVRVKGWLRDADAVYAKAHELCRLLDDGGTVRHKSISV